MCAKKASNSLKDLGKMIYSEEYIPETTQDDLSENKLHKQYLEAHFSKKGRNGKPVTVIKGFSGNKKQLHDLSKMLKVECAVGGSVKDGDIIIQGDYRDKITDILKAQGHRVKLVGG